MYPNPFLIIESMENVPHQKKIELKQTQINAEILF